MTTTLRRAFDDALDSEPPFIAHAATAAAAGRRIRLRRRAAGVGAVSASVALAALVAVPLLQSDPEPRDRVSVAPFQPLGGGASPSSPASASAQEKLTPEQQRVAAAIRAASPAGWEFELGADRWATYPAGGEGGHSFGHVEATADDGAGPGRMMIGMSPSPGSQQLHPCRDSEFASTAATCTERIQPDGSVLSLRALVDYKGIQTIYVVLTHPDGSGVGIESGNFTITWPLPRIASPETKRDIPQITRADPTYTLDQLAEVVLAVDRVVHG